MACHEEVENAFLRIGITHKAAARADGIEAAEAAGHELVWIYLMAGVPNEAMFGEIKAEVQSQAQFHTPRLLAKWAGRMLRTRTSSSRISWASCV